MHHLLYLHNCISNTLATLSASIWTPFLHLSNIEKILNKHHKTWNIKNLSAKEQESLLKPLSQRRRDIHSFQNINLFQTSSSKRQIKEYKEEHTSRIRLVLFQSSDW